MLYIFINNTKEQSIIKENSLSQKFKQKRTIKFTKNIIGKLKK